MLWSAAKPEVKLILLIAVGAVAQHRIPNFGAVRKGLAVLIKNVFVSTVQLLYCIGVVRCICCICRATSCRDFNLPPPPRSPPYIAGASNHLFFVGKIARHCIARVVARPSRDARKRFDRTGCWVVAATRFWRNSL